MIYVLRSGITNLSFLDNTVSASEVAKSIKWTSIHSKCLLLYSDSVFHYSTDGCIYFDYISNYIHRFMRMTIVLCFFSCDHIQVLGIGLLQVVLEITWSACFFALASLSWLR